MKRNGSNYVRVTLIKVKIPFESTFSSFMLKMDFGNQTQETEKLNGKEIELKKCFFFELPPDMNESTQLNFNISAFSKTLLIFDSEIGRLSIPLNQSKLIDRKEWFTLKNSKDENSLMLLLSFADMRDRLQVSNSVYLDRVNCSALSNQYVDNKMKISVVVSQNKNKVNYSRSINQPLNVNSSIPSLMLRNEINISEDRSGLVSPPSYRNNSNELAINSSIQNYGSGNGALRGDETVCLTTLESIFDHNDYTGLDINNLTRCDLLNNTNNEEMAKMKGNLKHSQDKLKIYELKILKEKESLEHNINSFKRKRDVQEKQTAVLNANFNKLEKELEKIKLERELMEENKKTFVNLNMMINSNSFVDLNLKTVNKLISVLNGSKSRNENSSNNLIHLNNLNHVDNIDFVYNVDNKSVNTGDCTVNKEIVVAKIESIFGPNHNSSNSGPFHKHSKSRSTVYSVKNSTHSNDSTLASTSPNNNFSHSHVVKKTLVNSCNKIKEITLGNNNNKKEIAVSISKKLSTSTIDNSLYSTGNPNANTNFRSSILSPKYSTAAKQRTVSEDKFKQKKSITGTIKRSRFNDNSQNSPSSDKNNNPNMSTNLSSNGNFKRTVGTLIKKENVSIAPLNSSLLKSSNVNSSSTFNCSKTKTFPIQKSVISVKKSKN